MWNWNRCKPTLRFVDVLEKPNPHCRLSNRVTLLLGKFQTHIWILPIWVHLNMTFCYFLKTITLYLSPVSYHCTVIIWKVVIFRILLLLPFCNNFVLIMLKRRKSKLMFFFFNTLYFYLLYVHFVILKEAHLQLATFEMTKGPYLSPYAMNQINKNTFFLQT